MRKRNQGTRDATAETAAVAAPTAAEPGAYTRRILIAVTGMSPQIVTETLYALAVAAEPAFVPTEIHLVTTQTGAERAQDSLLRPNDGWFHRLRRDYDLPPIAFDEGRIHVLKDATGQPLDDIRTPEDNTAAADAITRLLRELTSDDACALHASIAGGRKTMGFYLGYALSLYGRDQDRLSHVLVDPPYESSRDFYYPTPYSMSITSRSTTVDAKDGEVMLAEIPFVRLHHGVDERLATGAVSFSQAVADAQREILPVALILDPASQTVTAGGESFKLEPSKFALYWMLADRASTRRGGAHYTDSDFRSEYLYYYGRIVNAMSGKYEKAEKAYTHGMSGDEVNPIKSRIKDRLVKVLGRRRAAPYLIVNMARVVPNSAYYRFGLALPPDKISVRGGNPTQG